MLAADLADSTVLDPAGLSHRLGDAWAESPAVVVFLRHYG